MVERWNCLIRRACPTPAGSGCFTSATVTLVVQQPVRRFSGRCSDQVDMGSAGRWALELDDTLDRRERGADAEQYDDGLRTHQYRDRGGRQYDAVATSRRRRLRRGVGGTRAECADECA